VQVMTDDAVFLPVPGTLLCKRSGTCYGLTFCYGLIVAVRRVTYPTYAFWCLTLLNEGGLLKSWALYDHELQETHTCR